MKISIRTFLFIIICIFTTVSSKADDSSSRISQFSVGIENNRLIYGEYTYKNHLTGRLHVSVYSEKLGFQYVRATLGYKTSIKMIGISGNLFYGSAFNGSYYNIGARINADATFFKKLLVDATLAPWYDSGFKYTTCWEAKIGCKITRHIDIKAGYTTIPEYRMSEKRILAGFDFHTPNLHVRPYLSIGTQSTDGGKNIRVILGFGYNF